jgi:hypothetical protein
MLRTVKDLSVAALVALLAVSPVYAAGGGGRDGGGRGAQEPRGRPDDRGGYGRPDYRRMEREPQRRDGALSDEERRGLHRDLDKANRELYRRR